MNETQSEQNSMSSAPSHITPQKGSKLPWVLLIAAIVILGGIVVYLLMQLQSTSNSLTETKKELASTQTSIDKVVEPDDSKNVDKDDENDSPVSNDSDETAIINTSIAYGTARAGSENAKLEVSVTKKQVPFAEVNVGINNESGYSCTLKKSKGIWLVLYCGQSGPPQSTLDQWGIPASFAKSDY